MADLGILLFATIVILPGVLLAVFGSASSKLPEYSRVFANASGLPPKTR